MPTKNDIQSILETNEIILFDGLCNLCDSSVQFVLKRDPKKRFLFASLQSEIAQEYLKKQEHDYSGVDSILLVTNEKIYAQSSAALKIAKNISGLWPVLYIFMIVPKPIRDIVYNFIAKNRYKWFGKKEVCRIPTPEETERFI